MATIKTSRGRSLPLGASEAADGINFVLLCRHGTVVNLVVAPLDKQDLLTELSLDPRLNRTGDHWHIQVHGLPQEFRYGWRVDGPKGKLHYFDSRLVLLDPTATAISDGAEWGIEPDAWIIDEPQSRGTKRRSLYVRRPFDWQDDVPPLIALEDSIVYELHVRGFTCHPSSGVAHRGTFLGLTEKIPYLKDLGVTAVELLPVHEFDENDCQFFNPKTGEPLRNYWGYNSIAFAAPKAAYAAGGREHLQVNEFRKMVKRFHAAGIEVFLDVVFNHTGEGDHRGRTYSFRGLDNELYYLLGPNGIYLNFSGCGNTVNCNHPVVRDLIMDCLRYWVSEMHVDGLRFDLASVLGRDRTGRVMAEPPIVESIVEDGVLADTKLIAEPWDAGGLYQVGLFPYGKRWSEWNGQFRDDVRCFWRGDPGMAGIAATRMCGSADLYESTDRRPVHSINFVSCHDGFTLADLVSYRRKHNEENGEQNRDGQDENFSWNCGVEGPADDPKITEFRHRQARNLLVSLFVSQGVPMLLAGDEFLRTQMGNNNAWCQDNEISWVDWTLAEENADFLRFTKKLIALRKNHPALRRSNFFRGNGRNGEERPDIIWHGLQPNKPDFTFKSKIIACCLDGRQTGREPDRDFFIAFNAHRKPRSFCIPPSPNGGTWRRAIDTSLAAPEDIVDIDTGPVVQEGCAYLLKGPSALVLISDE